MPDIDFGQLSEALNDKSDRDLQNVDFANGADAVVAYQMPSAENNYTWYRLYASGWVEQGGIDTATTGNSGPGKLINLPIAMDSNTYDIQLTKNGFDNVGIGIGFESLSTTSFRWALNYSSTLERTICWEVKGIAATLQS